MVLEFAPASHLIDVEIWGVPRFVGAALLVGPGEAVVVDPGPSSALAGLERGLATAGIGVADLTGILLTHIHLDHAGAAGTLARANPELTVHVHEKGARHLVDPTKLLASAKRLYGDAMDALWGEFLAVPEAQLRALAGGESLALAGRTIEIAYTPGHASHHLSAFDTSTGTAFVGDTTGIRIEGRPLVLPVTPPPDIDLDHWPASLEAIEAWRPERLFLTHFGTAEGVEEHLDSFRARLASWSRLVKADVESGAPDVEASARFTEFVGSEIDAALDLASDRELYRQGGAPDVSWRGLARYWRGVLAPGAQDRPLRDRPRVE